MSQVTIVHASLKAKKAVARVNALLASLRIAEGDLREVEREVEDVPGLSTIFQHIGDACPRKNQTPLGAAMRQAVLQAEAEFIAYALTKTCGNITHAAKLLGMSRKGLQIKIRRVPLKEAPLKLEMHNAVKEA